MKTEDIKNKLNCEKIDIEEISVAELKNLRNQAKSLTYKRMKRKCKYEICIEQEMIEEKTNEITTIPKLIERLNLKGVICTNVSIKQQK